MKKILDEKTIKEIRKDILKNEISLKNIAIKYKVNYVTIYRIKTNRDGYSNEKKIKKIEYEKKKYDYNKIIELNKKNMDNVSSIIHKIKSLENVKLLVNNKIKECKYISDNKKCFIFIDIISKRFISYTMNDFACKEVELYE